MNHFCFVQPTFEIQIKFLNLRQIFLAKRKQHFTIIVGLVDQYYKQTKQFGSHVKNLLFVIFPNDDNLPHTFLH